MGGGLKICIHGKCCTNLHVICDETILVSYILFSTKCRVFADLPISVKMRGPYGNMQIDLYNPAYKKLIFIAGGVGAAVIQSMIEALIFYYTNYETENNFCPDIKLVIVSQNRSLYEFVNKRLEYYSKLRRPCISLDIYWTSKYLKYIQKDDNDAIEAQENLMSNPVDKPFEIHTMTLNNSQPVPMTAEEEEAQLVPADGFVSESYKEITQAATPNKKSGIITAPTTPVTPVMASKSAKVPINPSINENAQTPDRKSSGDNPPVVSDKKEKRDKLSAEKTSSKSQNINGDLSAQSAISEIDTHAAVTPSPTKSSKHSRRARKNANNSQVHVADLNEPKEADLTAESSIENIPADDIPVSSSKKSKKKNKRKEDFVEKPDGSAVVNEGTSTIVGVPALGTSDSKKEALFTPSTKSPYNKTGSTDEGAMIAAMMTESSNETKDNTESPMRSVKSKSSRHIEFGPVKEPPKSRIEDFIVYDSFYENILKRGRPNVEDIITNEINSGVTHSDGLGGREGDTNSSTTSRKGSSPFSREAVIVCGPSTLIASTRAVCCMYNLDMHEQIFDYK